MSWLTAFTLLLALWTPQSDETPAYMREGDRVEQQFRVYRDRLNRFFTSLRSMVDQQPASTAATLPRLQQQDAPPPAISARYGHGILPRIVDSLPPANAPVSVFNYSWPITDGYIAGESVKLDQAEE